MPFSRQLLDDVAHVVTDNVHGVVLPLRKGFLSLLHNALGIQAK